MVSALGVPANVIQKDFPLDGKVMDISGEDFERYYLTTLDRYRRDPNLVAASLEDIKLKSQIELEMTEANSGVCPVNKLVQTQAHEQAIDFSKLKSGMGDQFYNIDVMQGVSCVVDSLFYTMPTTQGTTARIDNAKKYITGAHRIGDESAEGYAIAVDVKDAKELFVVKISRDPKSVDLVHEQFVGGVLNQLRSEIPTLAMVFGGVRAPPPTIDPNTREITNLFDPKADGSVTVPYVMYENIAPSVTIGEYISTGTPQECVSAMSQIFLGLNYANVKLDYTHYDLHSKNALAREVTKMGFSQDQAFQIPFPVPGREKLYVVANRVMTIIDYGNTFLRTTVNGQENVGFGMHTIDLIPYAQFPNHSFYIYDAYKLIMFAMRAAREKNNQAVFEVLTRMWRFFNKSGDPYAEIDKQWPQRYALPYNDTTSSVSILDLFDHCMNVIPEMGTLVSPQPHPSIAILSCNSHCSTFNSITQSTNPHDSEWPVPSSFLEMYDMKGKAQHPHWNPDMDRRMMNQFDYQSAKDTYLKDLYLTVTKLLEKASMSKKINLSTNTRVDYQLVTMMRSSYKNIFEMRDLMERLESLIDAGTFVAGIYKDNLLLNKINIIRRDTEHALNVFCEVASNAMSNYMTMHEYMKQTGWEQFVAADPQMAWFANHGGDIMSINSKKCILNKNLPTPVSLPLRDTLATIPTPVVLPLPVPATVLTTPVPSLNVDRQVPISRSWPQSQQGVVSLPAMAAPPIPSGIRPASPSSTPLCTMRDGMIMCVMGEIDNNDLGITTPSTVSGGVSKTATEPSFFTRSPARSFT
jgi:hypothetical protein